MNADPAFDSRLEFDQADRLRRALRISDVSVADIAEYLGVSRGAVSTWINGRIKPSKQTLRLFALRTGVPFEWLETGSVGWAPSGSNRRPADYKVDGSDALITPIDWIFERRQLVAS